MSRILIFGNIVKDVYLKISEENADFEKDEGGVNWINLGFNDSAHEFFHRTSIFGGALVSLEVLEKFGVDAKIAGVNEKEKLAAKEYRYILNDGKGAAYFSAAEKPPTVFEKPERGMRMIFVDRSAKISNDFSDKLLEYIEKNPKVLLVVYAPKEVDEATKKIVERAHLVFADKKLPENIKNNRVCYFDNQKIQFGKFEERWNLERIGIMTHLTVFSIATASIIGAVLRGEKLPDALKIARSNVERSSLDKTLGLKELKEILAIEKREANDLTMMARTLVASPKGILAADESGGSIHKKFESMGILDDETHRRDYRNLFFTTENLGKYVNGVILFDETARQKANNGQNFIEFLTTKGIIPGIKVDQGLIELPNSVEKYTQGLEGLEERLAEYYKMGLRFAKWRAAFEISETTPSDFAIQRNCEILAEYAKKCQDAKIVPIVEPEVVYDGNYAIRKNAEVTTKILRELFVCLKKQNVELAGTILKVNMVLAGKKFPIQSTPEEVGKATAEVLRNCVPKELAGVVFLSGGQSVEQATENLQAVINNGPFPWPVTFSFARALQDPALFAWKGNNENADEARKAFLERLIKNCEALKKK